MSNFSIVLKLERDPCADNIIFMRGEETFVITGQEYRWIIEEQKRIDESLASAPGHTS